MRALAINLSLIFITVITLPTFSQTTVPEPPISVQSPNTSSLALYGEIPVSYFTGVPEINIPLYTLKEKEVTLPLSLNYHASGVRPDTHPGWVGNGWSLSNPGVITRTVHDLPDDDNQTDNYTVPGYRSDYGIGYSWSFGGLNTNNWSSNTYMQNVASTKYMDYILDNEPDEFSFNFGNYSGKFYINNLGKWCSTDRRLTITQIGNRGIACPFTPVAGTGSPWTYGYPSSFAGFTITTEDGTKYVFGGTNAAIEYSIGFFAQNTDFWLLTPGISPKLSGRMVARLTSPIHAAL